jgi:hypothetical protein
MTEKPKYEVPIRCTTHGGTKTYAKHTTILDKNSAKHTKTLRLTQKQCKHTTTPSG